MSCPFKVGDFVKVKTEAGKTTGRIVKSGRNMCLVEFGVEPEHYADLDVLCSETRWVNITDIFPYKKKTK